MSTFRDVKNKVTKSSFLSNIKNKLGDVHINEKTHDFILDNTCQIQDIDKWYVILGNLFIMKQQITKFDTKPVDYLVVELDKEKSIWFKLYQCVTFVTPTADNKDFNFNALVKCNENPNTHKNDRLDLLKKYECEYIIPLKKYLETKAINLTFGTKDKK